MIIILVIIIRITHHRVGLSQGKEKIHHRVVMSQGKEKIHHRVVMSQGKEKSITERSCHRAWMNH